MLKHFLRQFHFTRAERYGAAALSLLAAALFLAPHLYRWWQKPTATDFTAFEQQIAAYQPGNAGPAPSQAEETQPVLFAFDPNTASQAALVRLGLSPRVAGTIIKYREHGGHFRTPDDLQKIYSLPEEDFDRLRPYVRIAGAPQAPARPVAFSPETAANTAPEATAHSTPETAPELFSFDPNAAPEAELLRLGLPKALVGRLLKYREKGGFFRDKTDFKKLYGLSEQDYSRLEPYINLGKSEVAFRPAAYAGGGGTSLDVAPPVSLDINTAPSDAWLRLSGVGPVRAQKIVRYRDRLGGFARIEQVAETFGLPDSVFQMIRPKLQLGAPVYRKINLNTATVEELGAHPYFDFKQARLIVAYREQHGGRFTTPDEIARIGAFTDRAWLEKVKPYLSVE